MTLSREKRTLFYRELRGLWQNSRLRESAQYMQHGHTSVLRHSLAVAYTSCVLAEKYQLSVDGRQLVRGALLHDYFLYDWHSSEPGHRLHGFRHPRRAWENAVHDLQLGQVEQDIILRHMFPLTPIPPRYLESWIVCLADKICASVETAEGIAQKWRRLRIGGWGDEHLSGERKTAVKIQKRNKSYDK